MTKQILKFRKNLEKELFRLRKAAKRRKGDQLKKIEIQIEKVECKIKEHGGFLTEEERQKLKEMEKYCDEDYTENLLSF